MQEKETVPFHQKSRTNKPIETDPYLKQIVKLPDKQRKAVMNVYKETMGEMMTERIFPSGTKVYQEEPDGHVRAEPYSNWSYERLGAAHIDDPQRKETLVAWRAGVQRAPSLRQEREARAG